MGSYRDRSFPESKMPSRQLAMNLSFFILLVAVFSDVSALSLERDINLGEVTNFTCPGTGVFPAQDCDKYYTCYENSPVFLWRCSNDFLFDLTYSGCNYPENVDCGDRNRPGASTSAPPQTTAAPGFTCPSDGFFPFSSTSCSGNYWICVAGQASPQVCPGGGIFDPDRGFCANPLTVSCYTNTPSQPPATTAGPFTCPPQDGSYANPSDCGSYYVCVNSVPNLIRCPDGLFYNPDKNVCDFPANVDCNIPFFYHRH